MPIGIVKFFNEDKGFGFISPEGGGTDVFIHVSRLRASGIASLSIGDRVSFSVTERNGRLQADTVEMLPKLSADSARRESPLVQMARARLSSASHDQATLDAWGNVVDYVKTEKSNVIYVQEAYGNRNGSRQPPFDGEYGKLSAWCKLVGYKLYWHDPMSGAGQGNAWTWWWDLCIERCPLPDERLKNKIIAEWGTPPGY